MTLGGRVSLFFSTKGAHTTAAKGCTHQQTTGESKYA
jgi:hypothetical protein